MLSACLGHVATITVGANSFLQGFTQGQVLDYRRQFQDSVLQSMMNSNMPVYPQYLVALGTFILIRAQEHKAYSYALATTTVP